MRICHALWLLEPYLGPKVASPGYWRDVGTLAALAAAQQDAIGSPPRFNLWNRRWPIRGAPDFEHAELATNDLSHQPASFRLVGR